MINIDTILNDAKEKRVSDVHITSEKNIVYRIDGVLRETEIVLSYEEKETLIGSMLTPEQQEMMKNRIDIDFCYIEPSGQRARVNVFYQQKKVCAALRIINDNIPTFDDLGIPQAIRDFTRLKKGLVLITGATGSGKSTTLAAIIENLNQNQRKHIITIEDPVEYLYSQKLAMIHQRELGIDVDSFSGALRSAMREDPDVILVGEMRDLETIQAAITAAETGHLVLSTLHTSGAASTIDRIIDVFPAHSQSQIRTQLASVLKGVVTQQLLPRAGANGRIAAFEIMIGVDAVASLIREDKGHQLDSVIQTGAKNGMITMYKSLAELVKTGKITMQDAMDTAPNQNELMLYLK